MICYPPRHNQINEYRNFSRRSALNPYVNQVTDSFQKILQVATSHDNLTNDQILNSFKYFDIRIFKTTEMIWQFLGSVWFFLQKSNIKNLTDFFKADFVSKTRATSCKKERSGLESDRKMYSAVQLRIQIGRWH